MQGLCVFFPCSPYRIEHSYTATHIPQDPILVVEAPIWGFPKIGDPNIVP